MTKTHRENIPFFSDLPAKAERAASRLFDAARSPAYNGPIAYRDFVQDLQFLEISAPPRAVVNRWVSGVQAGLVSRPGGEPELSPEPAPAGETVQSWAYFDALPVTATPALQAAWDRASVDGFTDSFILSRFRTDLAKIGHADPSKIVFSHWLTAVRAGKVTRPGKLVTEDQREQLEEAFERLTPASFGSNAIDIVAKSIDVPAIPLSTPDPALVMIRDRMIEEEFARLTSGARLQAAANVAARFRTIAGTLEPVLAS